MRETFTPSLSLSTSLPPQTNPLRENLQDNHVPATVCTLTQQSARGSTPLWGSVLFLCLLVLAWFEFRLSWPVPYSLNFLPSRDDKPVLCEDNHRLIEAMQASYHAR